LNRVHRLPCHSFETKTKRKSTVENKEMRRISLYPIAKLLLAVEFVLIIRNFVVHVEDYSPYAKRE